MIGLLVSNQRRQVQRCHRRGRAQRVGGAIRLGSPLRRVLPRAFAASRLARHRCAGGRPAPDLILTLKLDHVGSLDFNRCAAIAAGEEAVWSRIEEIRALIEGRREKGKGERASEATG
ncbi:MAG: hypothetical protein U0232_17345 [Thermomicrobiales bacterium]